MKRTKVEKEIWKKIYYFFFLNLLNILVFGIGIYREFIVVQIISIISLILVQICLIHQGYTLGWEYKRLEMEKKK